LVSPNNFEKHLITFSFSKPSKHNANNSDAKLPSMLPNDRSKKSKQKNAKKRVGSKFLFVCVALIFYCQEPRSHRQDTTRMHHTFLLTSRTNLTISSFWTRPFSPHYVMFRHAAPRITIVYVELPLRELCSLNVECCVITGLLCVLVPVTNSPLLQRTSSYAGGCSSSALRCSSIFRIRRCSVYTWFFCFLRSAAD
jgi:hypothetical protein